MTIIKMMLAALVTASLALPVWAQDEGGGEWGGDESAAPAGDSNMNGSEGADTAGQGEAKPMKKMEGHKMKAANGKMERKKRKKGKKKAAQNEEAG